MILQRKGYDPSKHCPGPQGDLGRYCAFTYNFYSLGRQFYTGVVDTLESLKKNNILLGILSNAQFYTPIDLTLFVRDQSKGKYDDYLELFEPDLIFYSYEYGIAKPDQLLFRRLYDVLYELHVLPTQTVFVGNDLAADIKPAIEAGMRTALFTGDMDAAFINEAGKGILPDISFQHWPELSSRISFFTGK
jgi:putative hydrolase of the HAD superfamily